MTLENWANDESPVDDLGVLLVVLDNVVIEEVVDIGTGNWFWNSCLIHWYYAILVTFATIFTTI